MSRQSPVCRVPDQGEAPNERWCLPSPDGVRHLTAIFLAVRLMLWGVRSLAFSRQALVLDNLALRHQLATLTRQRRRPASKPSIALLACLTCDVERLVRIARYRQACHRGRLAPAGVSCLLAAHFPQAGPPSHRRSTPGSHRSMVKENHWGAPRIHGELLELGFRVSERTVSRYRRACRPRRAPGVSWKTCLNNRREALVAMDFFFVPLRSRAT